MPQPFNPAPGFSPAALVSRCRPLCPLCPLLKAPSPVCHNQASLTKAEFILDGNLDELARLIAEIGQFCRANQLSSQVEFDLNLALEELFSNTVAHGGCRGMPAAARVQLRFDGQDVTVLYSDRGLPFNPLQAPPFDPATSLALHGGRGLGIHLVRQIMVDLAYQRSEGWNRITMRRAIPTAVFRFRA